MKVCKLAVAVLLAVCTSAFGQTSFWSNSITPNTISTDTMAVTLGLKFSADVPGSVTGVRFYKASRNTGTHIGNLWSQHGRETRQCHIHRRNGFGLQQANFSSPVKIAANTTYIVSYSAPYGAYAHQQYYPWSNLDAGSLKPSGASAGVFSYGSSPLFPSGTWNNSNYFVDLIFTPSSSSPPDSGSGSTSPGAYTISGKISGSSATVTLSGTSSGSTTTNSTGVYSFSGIRSGTYVVASSQSGYTFTPPTASVVVNGSSVANVNFTATPISNPVPRTVSLSWSPTKTPNVKGYNLYRAAVAGGAFVKLNASPLPSTAYNDSGVTSGRIYYYVATAVDNNNQESPYSNQATAAIP